MNAQSTSGAYVFEVKIPRGSTNVARLVEGFSAGKFRKPGTFLRRLLSLVDWGVVRRIR